MLDVCGISTHYTATRWAGNNLSLPTEDQPRLSKTEKHHLFCKKRITKLSDFGKKWLLSKLGSDLTIWVSYKQENFQTLI